VSRIPQQNAYVALLCNQSDLPGSNTVWQMLNRMNTEIIHVVTEQPYKIPTKPKPSQAKKLYELVCNKGVDAAIIWFHKNGKKNPWGGSFDSVARELIRSGRKEEAILLYEYDIHQAPNKIWIQRKLAELCIQMGKFKKADTVLEQALTIRPDDQRLIELQNEVRHRAHQQGLNP
jgi:tetratricopeptide (TPR) repeat protein